jgi:hypothetical protein
MKNDTLHVLIFFSIIILLLFYGVTSTVAQPVPPSKSDFRPPAIPLIACDPYFSIWSMSDKLTDDWPRHWTGKIQAMVGMVRIDGKPYRIMGRSPSDVPALAQTDVQVYPTRTVYQFGGGGVNVSLTFMTPAIPYDLDLLSRPVGYLTWGVRSTDGKKHAVSLYYDNSAELVVNTSDQKVVWSRHQLDNTEVLRMGTQEQPVLQKSGDNLRIDWGYLFIALPQGDPFTDVITSHENARHSFASKGILPASDDLRMPRPADDEWPVMAVAFDLGTVGDEILSRHIILAYDEVYSIEYFNRKLRPYWRRKGMEVEDLLKKSAAEYDSLVLKCESFDWELMADLKTTGGEEYMRLATLAYRQCIAAHTLAIDMDGTPLFFPKENFSNGCISTVDVLYPASPFYMLFSSKLLKASLTPVMQYASSERWNFPFAPHDLGTYPLANGQVYGGGERTEEDQMPVEESGNMLLMVAAMAKIDGNADYALKYWGPLTKWADYLLEKGFDPENQLCTDDFAGHLAHNTNLSIKAILALGGYAMLCDMAGKHDDAVKYRDAAKQFSAKWKTMAGDGGHYRLAFDKPGTWSQKYNLVWDKLLGLNLFSPGIAQEEIAFYLKKQNTYGLPLDNRKEYTKLDWITWSATLAESPADFRSIISPVYKFMNESPSRVPLTDWYMTTDAKQVAFQARSVVGGVFVKMLSDPVMWKKWSKREK